MPCKGARPGWPQGSKGAAATGQTAALAVHKDSYKNNTWVQTPLHPVPWGYAAPSWPHASAAALQSLAGLALLRMALAWLRCAVLVGSSVDAAAGLRRTRRLDCGLALLLPGVLPLPPPLLLLLGVGLGAAALVAAAAAAAGLLPVAATAAAAAEAAARCAASSLADTACAARGGGGSTTKSSIDGRTTAS